MRQRGADRERGVKCNQKCCCGLALGWRRRNKREREGEGWEEEKRREGGEDVQSWEGRWMQGEKEEGGGGDKQ